jgi:hypothetical protein
MMKKVSSFVLGFERNPQRTPGGTPPVSSRLRPRWKTFLIILMISFIERNFSNGAPDRI